MKKQYSVLVVIIFIMIGIIYFGYKSFILDFYNTQGNSKKEYLNHVKELKIDKVYEVKHNANVIDYIEFKNLKIRNDFKTFVKESKNNIPGLIDKYVLYNENGAVLAEFKITTYSNYIELFKRDATILGKGNNIATTLSMGNIIEKNNIRNDIDLFKYISEYKPINKNICTDIQMIKDDYSVQYSVLTVIPKLKDITEIRGDITGYILVKNDNVKEVSILDGDKRYILTFTNKDYFTDDVIYDLLNTIIIKK